MFSWRRPRQRWRLAMFSMWSAGPDEHGRTVSPSSGGMQTIQPGDTPTAQPPTIAWPRQTSGAGRRIRVRGVLRSPTSSVEWGRQVLLGDLDASRTCWGRLVQDGAPRNRWRRPRARSYTPFVLIGRVRWCLTGPARQRFRGAHPEPVAPGAVTGERQDRRAKPVCPLDRAGWRSQSPRTRIRRPAPLV